MYNYCVYNYKIKKGYALMLRLVLVIFSLNTANGKSTIMHGKKMCEDIDGDK